MTDQDAARGGPLAGVRVLDFTRVLAGPFSTQVLGDLGAEVIKLEEPGNGDDVRAIAPFYPGGESHYFLSLNRNKRSVVVDLKHPEGTEFALALARSSDVVIENFRPGVLDRLGLGFDALRAVRPDIILCSISGYGFEGPERAAPAFDLVIQARSGAMSVNGERNGAPTKLGLPVGDLGGGLWATIAILAALHQRATDSRPQHIDVSLLEGLIALQGYLNQMALLTGESPPRTGSDHHNVAPYGRYRAKDGFLVIAILVGSFWERFCSAIGRSDLAFDPRFATNDARIQNREALQRVIEEVLATRTRDEWCSILAAEDVPGGPVLEVAEALQQNVLAGRGLLRTFEHPTAGKVEVVGSPLRVNGASPDRLEPPPLLGEHTRRIARELAGLSDTDIDSLIERSVLHEHVGIKSRGSRR